MDRFRTRGFSTDEGWFRVGTVEVTSGVLIAALSTISMFVYAVDQTLLEHVVLIPEALSRGHVWRLVTWWMVNGPSLGSAIAIAIFWWIGRLIERDLGRVRFLWFVAIQVLVPAILTCAYALAFDAFLVLGGIEFLEISVVIAVAVAYPRLRSFFNIPFWVLAAVVVGVDVLQYIGDRAWAYLVMLLLTALTATLMMRAFGLAEQESIPKIPLPSFITGDPYQKANRAREKAQRRAAKGKPAITPTAGATRRSPKAKDTAPATVTPIRPEARLDRSDQADMDALLDKISATGIDSLTPDERRRLDEHSRRLRGQ